MRSIGFQFPQDVIYALSNSQNSRSFCKSQVERDLFQDRFIELVYGEIVEIPDYYTQEEEMAIVNGVLESLVKKIKDQKGIKKYGKL